MRRVRGCVSVGVVAYSLNSTSINTLLRRQPTIYRPMIKALPRLVGGCQRSRHPTRAMTAKCASSFSARPYVASSVTWWHLVHARSPSIWAWRTSRLAVYSYFTAAKMASLAERRDPFTGGSVQGSKHAESSISSLLRALTTGLFDDSGPELLSQIVCFPSRIAGRVSFYRTGSRSPGL